MTAGRMARLVGLGFEVTTPPAAGALFGHFVLDPFFGTDPWLTLVMFLLGVFLGFYRLIAEVRDLQKSQ
jgi:F0F1-type ATP synthase assembly protein I